MEPRKYDLEERLVDYTCRMIDVVEALPATKAGSYIAGQLSGLAIHPLLITEKPKVLNPLKILFIKWALLSKN